MYHVPIIIRQVRSECNYCHKPHKDAQNSCSRWLRNKRPPLYNTRGSKTLRTDESWSSRWLTYFAKRGFPKRDPHRSCKLTSIKSSSEGEYTKYQLRMLSCINRFACDVVFPFFKLKINATHPSEVRGSFLYSSWLQCIMLHLIKRIRISGVSSFGDISIKRSVVRALLYLS